MQLHEVFNRTVHPAVLGFAQDPDGRDVAVALLKATFTFSANGGVPAIATGDKQLPVFLADTYAAAPGDSPLLFASDLTSAKEGTDVAIHGHAYGHGSELINAGFRLGKLEKVIHVHGTRVVAPVVVGYAIGHARPFDKMSVGYERAYGGKRQDENGQCVAYPWNTIGKGFYCPERGTEAPNLERPSASYLGPDQKDLEPAALGFIPAGWRQRARFAGTFDADWMAHRRPLLPKDFNPRFYNTVAQDQILTQRLAGGEDLTLLNLHPKARTILVKLPKLTFAVEFLLKTNVQRVPMVADTLVILPDEERFAVTFRASCPLREDVRYVRSVTIAEPVAQGAVP